VQRECEEREESLAALQLQLSETNIECARLSENLAKEQALKQEILSNRTASEEVEALYAELTSSKTELEDRYVCSLC
jgi:hypothetical protein